MMTRLRVIAIEAGQPASIAEEQQYRRHIMTTEPDPRKRREKITASTKRQEAITKRQRQEATR